MRDLLLRFLGKCGCVEKFPCSTVRSILIRVVGGEKNAVDANDFDGTLQVGLAEHSARCDVEVLAHTIDDGALELCDALQRIQALSVKENYFSPMSEDDL